MMTLLEQYRAAPYARWFLEACQRLGLEVRACDGKLVVSPREKISPDCRRVIGELREAILTQIHYAPSISMTLPAETRGVSWREFQLWASKTLNPYGEEDQWLKEAQARSNARRNDASHCYACGGDTWKRRDGGRVCRSCHPPAPGAEAAPEEPDIAAAFLADRQLRGMRQRAWGHR